MALKAFVLLSSGGGVEKEEEGGRIQQNSFLVCFSLILTLTHISSGKDFGLTGCS